MNEQTVKCPICGKPYVTYSHYAGDQSACHSCRSEARKHVETNTTGTSCNFNSPETIKIWDAAKKLAKQSKEGNDG